MDENNVDKSAAYTWSDMMRWVPTAEGTIEENAKKMRSTPNKSDIKDESTLLDVLLYIQGSAFTDAIDSYYDSITLIAYTLKTYDPQSLEGYLMEYYSKYIDHRAIYEDFTDSINGSVSLIGSFSKKMSGIATAE